MPDDPASHRAWCATLKTALPRVPWRTRFAPAPTGYLHLGHVVNAIHVWGVARAYGGEVILRIEDHDRTRCRPEFETALLDDLDWLGFHADHFPTASYREHTQAHPAGAHPARQSDNGARYTAALTHCADKGVVYPCRCTRRDIAARVPHVAGEEPRYPGTCRDRSVSPAETFARRIALDARPVAFTDLRLGDVEQTPATQCGDVLVRDRHAQWTYQFAVVVDDMAHDIDVVIRGADLLSSTGRQIQLGEQLGRMRPATFLHHTLLVHDDGSKLSKASHDTSLRDLRAAGASAESLIGLAAARAGLIADARDVPVHDIPALFVG